MFNFLKKKGAIFIGTPNKDRILGYIGGKANIKQKIWWNIMDYKYRILNKFENKYGAHAGFSKIELEKLFAKFPFEVENISGKYYSTKYKGLIRTILKLKRVQPAIYIWLNKC
jgi:hypothetical protein